MRVARILLVVALVGAAAAPGQTPLRSLGTVSERADSMRQEGRPWHAAELLLGAAVREPTPDAHFLVEGAKAELSARRYDRARSLLVGRPWLEDYENGEALAVLGQAEARLGQYLDAAGHLTAAWIRGRWPPRGSRQASA